MIEAVHRGKLIWKAALVFAFLQIASCAEFPSKGGTQEIKLIFTMTVAGNIQDDPVSPYVYIVAMYPSTDLHPTVHGPEPVIAPPWGNGIVAGNATAFVSYSLVGQPYDYTIYQFQDPNLVTYQVAYNPVPISSLSVNGGKTIQFEIALSQLAPKAYDTSQLKSVLVNFLTMDRIRTGSDATTKYWDALGDSRSVSSITDTVWIPLDHSATYDNNTPPNDGLEPTGDCPASPNLDITNFSVQVVVP
ncbi:MAG TPA: hypothetical protein VMI31_02995 [Fimbriimonadaceae bacterium]|nr:hypothetical protein [Fimbriimonadaceae bacterium]